jgi:hypothetical protein
MKTDRRKSPRRAISRRAKIEFAGGLPSRDCLVTDISDGGVRIFVEGGNVPDRFVLWFSDGDDSERPRACSVIWRLGPEVGAQFTDTTDDKARSGTPAREPAAV